MDQTSQESRLLRWIVTPMLVSGALIAWSMVHLAAKHDGQKFEFDMVRNAAIPAAFPNCVPSASGHVRIDSKGPVEDMDVDVEGLPPNTDFDFFVIQKPTSPFGMSWYQGDIETNGNGTGHGKFIGRFSIETFIVAPGSTAAPVVHQFAFPDASSNPPTNPIHTFHLGLWFNSPDDAAATGCPNTVTPFNGEHNAGLQVLNTSNFADLSGPLSNIQ